MPLNSSQISFIKNLVTYDQDEVDEDIANGNISGVLDDMVMDSKAAEGSALNNQGYDAQLAYLGYKSE